MVLLTGILITACHSSSSDNPDDGMPSAPKNLVAIALTDTSIRLTWDAADDDGWITGYDIERDEAVLSTNLDILVYDDGTVDAATTFTYQVIAVDNDGKRSVPAEVIVSTSESQPTINQANYVDVVAAVFDVFRGVVYHPGISRAAVFHLDSTPASSEYTYIDSDIVYESRHEYNCANDGSASVTIMPFYATDTEAHVATRFDDCAWDSIVYDGRIDWYAPMPHGYETGSYAFEELSLTESNGRHVNVEGRLSNDISQGGVDHVGDMHFWSANLVGYEQLAGEDGDTILTAVDTLFSYGRDRVGASVASLSGSFSLQSPATGNRPVDITVPEGLGNPNSTDRYFQQGSMVINANDGSGIRLDTVGDDPTTVRVSLTMDGETQVFNEHWDTWYANLTFD